MRVNKKTYWLQLPYLDEIFKRILLKSRVNIFNIFLDNIKFNKKLHPGMND